MGIRALLLTNGWERCQRSGKAVLMFARIPHPASSFLIKRPLSALLFLFPRFSLRRLSSRALTRWLNFLKRRPIARGCIGAMKSATRNAFAVLLSGSSLHFSRESTFARGCGSIVDKTRGEGREGTSLLIDPPIRELIRRPPREISPSKLC